MVQTSLTKYITLKDNLFETNQKEEKINTITFSQVRKKLLENYQSKNNF